MLLWLSGASREILDRCELLAASERDRFRGVGALLLIPAVLGCVSMMYALSTRTAVAHVYIAGGIFWGMAVLAIDRYAVSTLHKSKVSAAASYWTTLLVRYVWAILLGMAISHPLLLFYFDDSIAQRIAETTRGAIAARIAEAGREKAAVPTGRNVAEHANTVGMRNCLQRLLSAEWSGERVTLPCGYSSGLPDCGTRCAKLQAEIDRLDSEIGALAGAVRDDEARTRAEREQIDTRRELDLTQIAGTASADYLARVDALAELSKERPHVNVVSWFLLLVFVFIDVLPVTMKAATPACEYEHRRDVLLSEVQAVTQAERATTAAHYDGEAYRTLLTARFAYAAKREEVSHVTRATLAFLEELRQHRDAFERRWREMLEESRQIQDQQESRTRVEFLMQCRDVFNVAWQKGMSRFLAYLEEL